MRISLYEIVNGVASSLKNAPRNDGNLFKVINNLINGRFVFGLMALVAMTLACSPVIAISWNEFLIISIFIAVLLGPPAYRFIRRLEQWLRREKKDES
jgi:hypothetical protein